MGKLIEIIKGTGKGLVSGMCCLPFGLGQDAAIGLFRSIGSREGRVAYNSVMAAYIVVGTMAGAYFVLDGLTRQI